MGGELQADSKPGIGSNFVIRLTFEKGTAIEAPKNKQQRLPNNYRILVVEDNPVNQMTLIAMVKKLGCQAEKADNGEAAVRLATATNFDCILMDCQMPIMDGFEATRLIRELENRNAQVPIIAVTANAMSGDRERCLDAGMNDYIKKPIKLDVIRDRLLHWLIDKAA